MLHDFVYFDKRTGAITGRFRTSTPDLLPKPLSPHEGQAPVTDPEHMKLLTSEARGRRPVLEGKVVEGRITSLKVLERASRTIRLDSDLPDNDGDGVPELPADGQTVARIKATLEGGPGKEHGAPQVVRFRVTHGALSRRTVEVRAGVAEVDLRSSQETVQVRLTAAAEGYEPAALLLEFIPEEEFAAYRAGSGRRAGGDAPGKRK